MSKTVIDENGTITDTYTFDAFGNLTSSTGDTANTYLYCGEQLDSTTGLYYLRARYMNPSTGTFFSMDVYQGSIFDPISLHKYLYANVNPVMNCDPSGYDSVRELATATAGQGYISESRAKHDKTVMRIGLQSKLDEMEQLGQEAIDKMLMVRDLSVEQNAHTALAKVEQSIDIIAVEHGSQDQLNKILCYKLDLAEGECYYDIISTHDLPNDEKHNTLIGLSPTYHLIQNQGKNTLLADKALLHWITVLEKGNDVKENPMPEWWLKTIPKIPDNIVTEENYGSEDVFSRIKNEYYQNYYGVLEEIQNPINNDNSLNWYREMFGHLDKESDSVQRRKYLLEEMGLGTYKDQKYGLTVYTNDESPKFQNAQLLYLNLYGHYYEYHNESGNLNSNKAIAKWLTEDRINKIILTAEEQSFANDIIAGLYIQTDESIDRLSDLPFVTIEHGENGDIIIGTAKAYDANSELNYTFDYFTINVPVFNRFNQKYVSSSNFSSEITDYYVYKMDSDLYRAQCEIIVGGEAELHDIYKQIFPTSKEFTDEFDALTPEEQLAIRDYYKYSLAGSIRDQNTIDSFKRTRKSDVLVNILKAAIDVAAIVTGIGLSVLGLPVAGLVISTMLESTNIAIALEQGNNGEAVLRIIGTAVGVGIGISNIVKVGNPIFKAIAKSSGDDVARAIAEFADDFVAMGKHYDGGVVTMAKRYFAGVDDYLLKHPLKIEFPNNAVGGRFNADFYVAPNGKVLPGQYKDWLGTNIRDSIIDSVSDPKLKQAIGEVYRPGSIIGDGGTADIIRFEQKTGILLSKSGHIQKGIDMSKYFQKLIDSETLSPSDIKVAQKIINDLQSALGGK